MRTLTERQFEVLRFVADELMEDRVPSLRDIGDKFGIRSTNGVNDHVRALQRKGALSGDHRRRPGKGKAQARRLSITREGWAVLGADFCRTCGQRVLPGNARV